MDELDIMTAGKSSLTPAQIVAVEVAVLESRAPNTRRAYASAMKTFSRWCHAGGHAALPTSPDVVAAYLVELADAGRAMSTITVIVAAIGAAHNEAGQRNPVTHRGVLATMSGLRRRIGTAPRRRARALDLDEVKRILASIDRSTVVGKRDAALILLAFSSAMRRSELVALTRADIQLGSDGARITIRRSKADQEGAGAIIGIPKGHGATCPVRALRHWIGASGGSVNSPVFRRVSRTGAALVGGLTGQTVNTILQTRAGSAGVETDGLSAHSARSGHITQAAKAGVALDQIMRTSRHKSVSVAMSYVRNANLLEDSSASALGL